jgi:hypothetical protein
MLPDLQDDPESADIQQLALLVAITRRDPELNGHAEMPIVWAIEQELLDAGHLPETIDGAIAADLILRWQVPGAPTYVVPTPWGAWWSRVTIKERWIRYEIETKDGPKTYAVAIPCWIERPVDDYGDPAMLTGAMRQPKHANECRLPFPDQLPDPRLGPEYLADTETGETTQNERQAVKLFGGDGLGGIPITIDRRLRGKGAGRPSKHRKRRRTA